MATITQTIPSYNGGISQQPDELKVPGQVKDALNVLPDLTHGLLKRPGGKLVASLSDNGTAALNSNTNGKWFHYYRDENEQYIGQVNRSGDINMWCCTDIYDTGGTKRHDAGDSIEVQYDSGTSSALTTYLTHTADADIQTITLNDFTYIANRTITTAMSSTVETLRPKEAYIELKKVAYASQYSLNVYDSTTATTVYTGTRIKIKRTVDSSNACKDSSDTGDWPPSGTLPGSSGYTSRCDASAGENRSATCPMVATEIFSINHGDSGDSADANGTAHTYDVTGRKGAWATATAYVIGDTVLANSKLYRATTAATSSGSTAPSHTSGTVTSGGIAWEYWGLPSDRKNLYLRITTTGQAVPMDGGTGDIYRCRYTTTHDLLYGGEGWRTGDKFDIWMKNAKYEITFEDHSEAQVQATMDSNADSGLIRPLPTPFDTETTVTAESILGSLRKALIDQNNGLTSSEVTQIGNGLYITDGDAFNVSTPVGDLLNVFTDSIEDVADLPRQCKHGYVVRVANSAAEEDDYYLKFFGNNDKDGEGVWEECPKPGRNIEIDKATMPIQMVRNYVSNAVRFDISQVDWDDCPVGDTTTVPEPSFIGNKITKMLFWRNRLALLSDENINLSRPGSFYHFWPKTAVTYTATDNIDISCSSEYPAIVYDGIQVNQGLVLFTKNQQFMLTTDSDVLSAQTAKINAVSTYNFNFDTNPISLGTTVGFLDNGGKNTRFFEMSNVVREGAPDVIEQSKVVSRLFPKGISLIANSRENSVLFFAEKGKDEIYGYRYFSSIEKRVQNAWFRWKISGDIQHMAMMDDSLFVIVRNNDKDVMQQFTIKLDDATNTLVNDLGTDTTDDDLTYRLHLDNATSIAHTQLTYDSTNDWTTFPIPDGFNNTLGDLYAIVVPTTSDKTFQGMSGPAYTFKIGNTDSVKLPGNWKTYDPQLVKDSDTSDDVTPPGTIILGYTFDMEVKLPTIYYIRQVGEGYRSEHQGSLVLHRLKFSFGPIGVYETTLDRVGKRPYTELYEAVIADDYISNRVQFSPDQFATIPVYERNTNVGITLKSTHPSPATLFSMTWEGEYNNRYYKRV